MIITVNSIYSAGKKSRSLTCIIFSYYKYVCIAVYGHPAVMYLMKNVTTNQTRNQTVRKTSK